MHFVCALQEWSLCFPQPCWSPAIKSRYPSKSDSLGIPPPVAGPPGWEAWREAQDLHSSGWTSLVWLFSSLWVTNPTVMGFDFIVIVPFLPSHCSFSFVFGCGVSFFGEFQCLPVNDCSALSCDSGAVTRGSECTSFYSTILNQSLLNYLLKLKNSMMFQASGTKVHLQFSPFPGLCEFIFL